MSDKMRTKDTKMSKKMIEKRKWRERERARERESNK